MPTPTESKKPKITGDNSNSNKGAEPHFTGLPSTVVLVGVCSFLPLEDIYNLRLTSPKVLAILHGEGQDDLWKLVFQRDFGFTAKDLEDGPVKTVKYEHGRICSPSTNMIEPAKSHFDALKKWTKVSVWFYQGSNFAHSGFYNHMATGKELSTPAKAIVMQRKPFVHAPYFLRAACFWEIISKWCKDGARIPSKDGVLDSQEETRVRQAIYGSIGRPGGRFMDTICDESDTPGFLARQAVSAFSQGTLLDVHVMTVVDNVALGILGGYEAYGHVRLNSLFGAPDRSCVSTNLFETNDYGRIMLDHTSGGLYFKGIDGCKPVLANNQASRQDEFLLWLEEYACRLLEGEIGIGVLAPGIKAITLFPRYVPGATPKMVNDVPVVSRKVTKGVEVIASAVFAPQWKEDMGFVYSIRIRLLTPDDGDEYVSPSERGFVTCQLLQRHWRIVNDDTGSTQMVHGDGVIGMTPVLREYGYHEGGVDHSGTFQYQSCSGPMSKGSFGGHLTFEARPGNGATSLFDVAVGFFALDSQPDFLF